jgi:lipoprotein-anchoring transpeptidase ErfK/SrfK
MTRLITLALSLPLLVNSAESHARRPPVRHRAFDPSIANNPTLSTTVRPRSSGSAVLRAEILLDRAHFGSGEIDGSYSVNLRNTVKAYQKAHNLPDTGVIDSKTWKLLNQDSAPVLVPYTISLPDVAGPFDKIPSDMQEKAKLTVLGYESPLEGLSEKFHASPRLLQLLNPGKKFGDAGQEILAPDVHRAAVTGRAALVIVLREERCVEVLDHAQRVIAHYPATMGSVHDPLPIGEWKLHKPIKDPPFIYNSDLFWDSTEEHAKARIPPGPNNPVGPVWIGMSKEHYGIHGTPDPAMIGKNQSHGCIRLTNWDALELAGMVTLGMTASLREN